MRRQRTIDRLCREALIFGGDEVNELRISANVELSPFLFANIPGLRVAQAQDLVGCSLLCSFVNGLMKYYWGKQTGARVTLYGPTA